MTDMLLPVTIETPTEMSYEIYFVHPQLHLVWVKDNAAVLAPLKEIW